MTTPFPFTSGQVLTAAELNDITNLPINNQTASYVAVAGDAGKRIVMNVATANTVTIDDSVFAVGDTIFISTKDAATTVTAGAGVTINTAGSLVIAQHGGGTLVATSASVFTFFPSGGVAFGVATGGTDLGVRDVGGTDFKVLEFSSTGTLTVTTEGEFGIAAICGGGGGISGLVGFPDLANGGAGGGGFLDFVTTLAVGTYTITVGGGGATSGALGAASGLSTRIYNRGGGGSQDNIAAIGVCGSGSTRQSAAGAISFGNFSGFGGGGGPTGNSNLSAGGGGGAGGLGGTGSGGTGGAGGIGVDVSTFIGGSTLLLGGGGGSCGRTTGGTGNAGGGNGASVTGVGGNGTINTGGGAGSSMGGVGGVNAAAATGGSGIVFVRMRV